MLAGIRCEEEGRCGEEWAAQCAAERASAGWQGVRGGEGRRGAAGCAGGEGHGAGWARTGVGGAAPALPVAPAGEGGSEGVAWQRRISMPGAKQASIVVHQNWWVWVEGSLVL